MLTVIGIVTIASLAVLYRRVASLRCLVVRLAAAAKTRERCDATARHTISKTHADLLAAFAALHDEVKAERIARGAAAIAARGAERRALRSATASVTSDLETAATDNRETLPTVAPVGCEPQSADPEAGLNTDPEPTSVLSREALAAALRGSAEAIDQPPPEGSASRESPRRAMRPPAPSLIVPTRSPSALPDSPLVIEDPSEQAACAAADDDHTLGPEDATPAHGTRASSVFLRWQG